ncbi:hypothetical protein [Helicobacter sp. T3_23-1056]
MRSICDEKSWFLSLWQGSNFLSVCSQSHTRTIRDLSHKDKHNQIL